MHQKAMAAGWLEPKGSGASAAAANRSHAAILVRPMGPRYLRHSVMSTARPIRRQESWCGSRPNRCQGIYIQRLDVVFELCSIVRLKSNAVRATKGHRTEAPFEIRIAANPRDSRRSRNTDPGSPLAAATPSASVMRQADAKSASAKLEWHSRESAG